jgi:hypothetical protein
MNREVPPSENGPIPPGPGVGGGGNIENEPPASGNGPEVLRPVPPSIALFLVALLPLLALFLFLRWPLLAPGSIRRGWNGDTAIFGLMTNRILSGERFDVFFWGQGYLGPLTSMLAAAIGLVRRLLGLEPPAGPLALRLATMFEVASGALLYSLGLRRLFGGLPALAAALLVLVSPAWLFRCSVLPYGPGMILLLGGATFWLAAESVVAPDRSGPLSRPSGLIALGLLCGLGWWMNPGMLFVPLALGLVLLLRTDFWRALRDEIRLSDRLLLRFDRLGWDRPEPAAANLLRGLNFLPQLLWLHALLHESGIEGLAGLSLPIVFVFRPIAEPLLLFVALQIVLELALGRAPLRRRLTALRQALPGSRGALAGAEVAAAALLGCFPVWLGRLLDWYPASYSFSVGWIPPGQIVPRWTAFLARDVAAFLGAGWDGTGLLFLAAALALAAWQLVVRRRELLAFFRLDPAVPTPRSFAGAVVAIAVAFYLLSSTAAPGQHRYLTAAFPVVCALLADAAIRLYRSGEGRGGRLAARGGALLAGFFAVASVASSALTERRAIAAEPDRAPIIEAIEREGYRVCYANAWQGYELWFLSDERIGFIPWRSRDRNPAESRRLAALPGPRCFVDPAGRVSKFELPAGRIENRRVGDGGGP